MIIGPQKEGTINTINRHIKETENDLQAFVYEKERALKYNDFVSLKWAKAHIKILENTLNRLKLENWG